MYNRIVITGGSGFLGSYLRNRFAKTDCQIINLDKSEGYDITKKQSFDALGSFDCIIHLAAETFVPESWTRPYDFYNLNINGTLNVLEAAKKHNAKTILLSSYLYGEPDYLPIDELHPLKPHNPYAHSKFLCEKLAQAYYTDFNTPIVILRPFNIYGIGQNKHFIIPEIVNQLFTGKVKLKDPRPKRDFIHVVDVAEVIYNIAFTDIKGFEIFNIGSGKSHSIEDIIKYFKFLAKIPFEVSFTNEFRPNEVLDCIADISKIKTKLDWQPKISLESGLMELYNNKILYNE